MLFAASAAASCVPADRAAVARAATTHRPCVSCIAQPLLSHCRRLRRSLWHRCSLCSQAPSGENKAFLEAATTFLVDLCSRPDLWDGASFSAIVPTE